MTLDFGDVFHNGYLSGRSGYPHTHNPYESGTRNYSVWKAGHAAGRNAKPFTPYPEDAKRKVIQNT